MRLKLITNLKYAGTLPIHLCPECSKKGISTYIPLSESYCPYCKKKVQEDTQNNKYPIGNPWYLG